MPLGVSFICIEHWKQVQNASRLTFNHLLAFISSYNSWRIHKQFMQVPFSFGTPSAQWILPSFEPYFTYRLYLTLKKTYNCDLSSSNKKRLQNLKNHYLPLADAFLWENNFFVVLHGDTCIRQFLGFCCIPRTFTILKLSIES